MRKFLFGFWKENFSFSAHCNEQMSGFRFQVIFGSHSRASNPGERIANLWYLIKSYLSFSSIRLKNTLESKFSFKKASHCPYLLQETLQNSSRKPHDEIPRRVSKDFTWSKLHTVLNVWKFSVWANLKDFFIEILTFTSDKPVFLSASKYAQLPFLSEMENRNRKKDHIEEDFWVRNTVKIFHSKVFDKERKISSMNWTNSWAIFGALNRKKYFFTLLLKDLQKTRYFWPKVFLKKLPLKNENMFWGWGLGFWDLNFERNGGFLTRVEK